MSEQKTAIPPLPCPNCKEDIIGEGWHNSCSETVALREDNYTYESGGHFYMEHGEDDHETVEHTCEADAYCSSCNMKLPWTTFEIRELDGARIDDIPGLVAGLVAQAAERSTS